MHHHSDLGEQSISIPVAYCCGHLSVKLIGIKQITMVTIEKCLIYENNYMEQNKKAKNIWGHVTCQKIYTLKSEPESRRLLLNRNSRSNSRLYSRVKNRYF